ncbi:hypothetical protein EPUL_004936 [Erysiphe pulchra]|uniref:Delta(24)-sterol reductase n=1 Tax=Erysiphe pulchra TaxID=225359 RepID=A0A2S4PP59_9PEZI|nr:hypothetical protein EPUL_004936 [Erysiphe pulchra]
MDEHKKRIESISEIIRDFYERKEKWRVDHGSTNSTRPSGVKKNVVRLDSLSNILKIDLERKTCLVEPNVPMDRLVEATLKSGLMPPVVMEFPGITVGGGYSGTCGESSSFKHGFFDKTINSAEMILATGEVISISPKDNIDLFYGGAGAMGTFGVTTLIELQLQQAKKFVKTKYIPMTSVKKAIETIQDLSSDSNLDYIDGIMFSPTSGAVITGCLADTLDSDGPIARFSRRNDPWFYLHAKNQVKTGIAKTDFIPLADYFFRYDRGGFWVGAAAFRYFKVPFNRFTRWALDDFLHTRMMYTALHTSGQSKKFVVQDLALPYKTAEEFIGYTQTEFNIWPLWLCPLKPSPMPTMHPHSLFGETESDGQTPKGILNIGLWGWGPNDTKIFHEKNKALESKLKSLGGMKWLYAHTYYEPEEFWQQFDRKWYEDLRKKYKAGSLPNVYEKAKVNLGADDKGEQIKLSFFNSLKEKWPLPGLYGIKKAIESRSYISARKSEWKKILI